MDKITCSCVLFLVCVLTACATGPERKPPLDGLTNSSTLLQAKTTSIPNSNELRMALIVSSSTTTTFNYLSEMAERVRPTTAILFGQNELRLLELSANPQHFVDSIVFLLKDFVAEVVLVDDLAEFRQGNFDIAGVIDIFYTNSDSDNRLSNNYEITLIAINRSIEKIGQIVGRSTELHCYTCSASHRYSAWYRAQGKALEDFSEKLPSLFIVTRAQSVPLKHSPSSRANPTGAKDQTRKREK